MTKPLRFVVGGVYISGNFCFAFRSDSGFGSGSGYFDSASG